ncbi:Uma2 family endonuclease [Paraburkholderia dipogonis]|uniref:Uma2 family endonuclease n=1 Tax=Paraburkholderia dipogonis TaxID=1211383 RepID=A0A4Y8MHP9_9BURK|nr:Uma2 family endonuclease [Paraburkholderia dipogonis]
MLNPAASARRQIVLTDAYCQLTEQMGHLAVMSPAVVTRSCGIRVPDVVWMPCERWDALDRDEPMPFVPDICVEVLLDRQQDVDSRVRGYLESGGIEVIVINQRGEVEFWDANGRRRASAYGITLAFDRLYFEPAKAAAPGVR